ncbi:MAG: hypothetical protein QHJ73_16970 [Armatimonadota bacterium]|nr:hypothetical protein [Armatimonadota bacterium]
MPSAPRETWRDSRGRAIYNVVFSTIALVMGLVMIGAPHLFAAGEQTRILGGVLAGYACVRGIYFYRRLRAFGRKERP